MEQYTNLYDTRTIELTGIVETFPEGDGTDPFHREPYIASYRALSSDFDSTPSLDLIHTDLGEPDIVVMDDLNADRTT